MRSPTAYAAIASSERPSSRSVTPSITCEPACDGSWSVAAVYASTASRSSPRSRRCFPMWKYDSEAAAGSSAGLSSATARSKLARASGSCSWSWRRARWYQS